MHEAFTLMAKFTEGNTIAVVLAPVGTETIPPWARRSLWKVKIGVIDEEVARSGPPPVDDFRKLVRQLTEYLEKEGMM